MKIWSRPIAQIFSFIFQAMRRLHIFIDIYMEMLLSELSHFEQETGIMPKVSWIFQAIQH